MASLRNTLGKWLDKLTSTWMSVQLAVGAIVIIGGLLALLLAIMSV